MGSATAPPGWTLGDVERSKSRSLSCGGFISHNGDEIGHISLAIKR